MIGKFPNLMKTKNGQIHKAQKYEKATPRCITMKSLNIMIKRKLLKVGRGKEDPLHRKEK